MQNIILDILEYSEHVGYSLEDLNLTMEDAINILKENDFVVDINGKMIYNKEKQHYAMNFLFNL